ncbi:hypothetical protein RCZ01_24350 [Capnocytophaga felis]|uniref:Erythromycin esterase n=2 Tax=Capnocytophaga felis TaxID=2267611 RepID=A0A5M4BC37_9FLAO|nr:hypothetical protein RCZ01_24350 [Capnocytophaga felis]GET49642.1 hypothetical protein RCZ02_24730 [Capnocytophaga felis]
MCNSQERKDDFSWIVYGDAERNWKFDTLHLNKQIFLDISKKDKRSDTLLLFNHFFVPKSKNKFIEIDFLHKNENMTETYCLIKSIDKTGNIIRQDSINLLDIRSLSSFKRKIPKKNVYCLRTELFFVSKQNFDSQIVVKKPNFSIGKEKEEKEEKQIPLKITSLIPNNILIFDNIDKIKNNKILAIGETIHGSESLNRVAFDIMKYRIMYANCRLLFFEFPVETMLIYNRYIQGDDIDLESIFNSLYFVRLSDETLSFFSWLRDFNKERKDKVWIFGVDVNIYDPLCFYVELFDYFKFLYMQNNKKEELQSLAKSLFFDKNFVNKIDIQPVAIEFKIIQNYFDLMVKYSIKGELPNNIRDIFMYKNMKYIINIFASKTNTITIYSHLGHSCYDFPFVEKNYYKPFGYYLKKDFKEDYSCIGLTVGEGAYTAIDGKETLIKNERNTITNILNKENNPFFYIKSENISQYPVFISQNKAVVGIPKFCFEGVIYLENSTPSGFFRNNIPLEDKMKRAFKKQNAFFNKAFAQ